MSEAPTTLGTARDRYLERATLRSKHTVAAYRQSIASFLRFLDQTAGRGNLPLQQKGPPAERVPLSALDSGDAPILVAFAEWLLGDAEGDDDPRPYAPATVRLRLAGVGRWLQWLDDYGWLPPRFPLAKAQRMVRDELRAHQRTRGGPPQPPRGIEELLTYYERLRPPRSLARLDPSDPRHRRWELTRLRNHAIVWALAESGGRVSEVLSLDLSDLAPRDLEPPHDSVVRVQVVGKGQHVYQLRLHGALPAIADYVQARGANLRAAGGKVPLFVSHDPRAEGKRLSRTAVWRVVTMAARGLGLRPIHPHDLRHWRATQLVNAGQPLDVVQDYLGHRSVETTRAYYARTDPSRVDEAALDTPVNEDTERD
jgi:site-specific recombinase XerD